MLPASGIARLLVLADFIPNLRNLRNLRILSQSQDRRRGHEVDPQWPGRRPKFQELLIVSAYGLVLEVVRVCVIPRLRSILTSTRRFWARPEAVVLSATASVLPYPIGVMKRRSGIL